MTSHPRSPVLGTLALVLLVPAVAAALEVKVWPLFRYRSERRTGEVRWSALGPLVEFRETRRWRDLRLRPVLWLRQRRGAQRDDRADILFPLASTRWQDDHQHGRLLLLSWQADAPARSSHAAAAPPADWARRFTLFPLVFWRSDPGHGASLSVLPFWLDQEHLFGWARVQAILFPAYLRLVEPRVERRWWGFPFVSTVGGPDGRGVRLWPFWGQTEVAGRSRTAWVLWPFHIRQERLVPGYGWERRRVDFPIFAAIDGAGVRSRAWGVFAWTHTRDDRSGEEITASPWPLVLRARALGAHRDHTWRIAPFYGRSARDGITSRFWLWPAWREKRQDAPGFHYRRRDVGLVLWRDQRLTTGDGARREHLRTMFPLVRRASRNGRRFGQSPALIDSLLPTNRGVLALWAPLWALVRWDTTAAGDRDWSILWGLVARERGRLRGPIHVDLGHREEPDGT